MKFVTVRDWSWTKFHGKEGDKLTNDLPEDVIAALLKQGAIEPIDEPDTLVSSHLTPWDGEPKQDE